MTPHERKRLVAEAALVHVPAGAVIGIGTGSTVDCFIDALAAHGPRIAGAVSSSVASGARLQGHGIAVVPADTVETLPVYIDGADELDRHGCMIKGGGAALTREKIVADMSARFVCIADGAKLVTALGGFPVPIEVVPMAAAHVMRRLRGIGAMPALRAGVVTDNGGLLIDVRGLVIDDPLALETELNQWPGIVTVGIFARNRAHLALLADNDGVRTIVF